MLIARILAVQFLSIALCNAAGIPAPSPCTVSVSPNPARAGQSLVMHARCFHCTVPRTTTIAREGTTIIVTDRIDRSCVPFPGISEEFELEIGAFLPGEYTLVHFLETTSDEFGSFTFDPVTTGFVVEAQVVPASGAASLALGVLAVLALGMGMLWRHRTVQARSGRDGSG